MALRARGEAKIDEGRTARLWLAAAELPAGACGGATHKSRRAQERAATNALLAYTSAPARPRRSLSHSGGCVAIAIAPAGCVAGVDIESMQPRDVNRLAEFAFARTEAGIIQSLDSPAAITRFYILWTLKEAFAKALGLTLPTALRECLFACENGRWRAQLPTLLPWRAIVFAPRPAFMLAAAIVGPPASVVSGWVCREWPAARANWGCQAVISCDQDTSELPAAAMLGIISSIQA